MKIQTKILVWVNGIVTPLNWLIISLFLYFGDTFDVALMRKNQFGSTIFFLLSILFFIFSCLLPGLWAEGKIFWRRFSFAVEVFALGITIVLSLVFKSAELLIPAIFTSTITSLALISGLLPPTSDKPIE